MASSPLIDEIGTILATAFASGIASAAGEIDQNLQRQSASDEAADQKAAYLSARNFFASHLTAFERALNKDYQQRFTDKLAGEAGQFFKTMVFSLDSLSLVEDAAVDENILIANTGRRLREDCDYEFFALSRRFEILLGVERLEDNDNPASPSAFCRSFFAALTAIDASPTERAHIFNAAKSALTRILQTSYQNVNEFLINKGVLIEIHKTYGKPVLSAESRITGGESGDTGNRPGANSDNSGGSGNVRASTIRRPNATSSSQAPPPSAEMDAEQPEEMDTLFSQLLARHGDNAASTPSSIAPAQPVHGIQALLAMLKTGANKPAPMPTGGTQDAHAAGLLAALEKLSRETVFSSVDDATVPRGASLVPSGFLHEARRELVAQMQPAEKVITDVVVGMFDGIFAVPELPDGIKAQLSRLQFPLLKSAMKDASLLTDDSHPLRILIDQVAELSLRHGEQLKPGNVVYDRVRTLLQYFLAILNTDALAIADVNEQLQELIEADDDRAQASIADLKVQQVEAERSQRAIDIVTYEIDRRIASPAIPEVVKLFATKAWRWLLMIDYLADGEDSDNWKKDIATFEDLLWSVNPASSKEARLPVLILQLVARLNEALNRAGVARTERVAFYDRLAEIHRAILDPATNSNARHTSALAMAAAEPAGEFIDPRTRVAQRSLKLARGAWILARLNGVSAQRCRLLWISPLQTSYIFRNYSAEDAEATTVIMRAEALDDDFKRGILSVIDSTPLTRRSIETTVRAMLADARG